MSKAKKKSSGKGVAWLFLLLGWLLFALFAVVFYFYFMEDLPFYDQLPFSVSNEANSSKTGSENAVTYETNANAKINALITAYYYSVGRKDQEKLMNLVIDSAEFSDMSFLENNSVTSYSNVNCYTVKGYSEDATVVYVISNLTIAGVVSSPLDIQCFYVRKLDEEYKIDNRPLSEAEQSYVNSVTASEAVQALYKTVEEDNQACAAKDASYANFYNKQ